jgi:RNA polymerase sigma-70 factor (family 1)
MPRMDNMLPVTLHTEECALDAFFTKLFKTHEYALHTLVLRLTRSDLHAKDIIQEVFLKLWEHRHNIDDIENMEAWLYRLTENKIIDLLRKTAANDRLKQRLRKNTFQSENEAEASMVVKEYNLIIRKAIDQLPPQRKLIYQLNKEKGLSYKEIADKLHISRHTVKNQLSAAIQSVRSWFLKSARFFVLF